jgi:hypothetical protein
MCGIQVLIERTIVENIIRWSPMTLSEAVLSGVTTNCRTVEIGRHRDVYELLETCELPKGVKIVGLVVHATGWAAPLNADGEVDGRPSEHAERQRCALVVCRTAQKFCSALKLENTAEVEYEQDSPRGSLWEALSDCFVRLGI